MEISIHQHIGEIIQLYNEQGKSLYYVDNVSQTEDALQCSHEAGEISEDEELVAAAFLHDLGYLLSNANIDTFGIVPHEQAGAEYLKQMGFSHRVTSIIQSHVLAKRYLVSTQSDYFDKLSSSSKKSFVLQGGTMTQDEIDSFENQQYYDDIITLRICDDRARSREHTNHRVEDYRPILISVLEKSQNNLL